MPNYAPRVSIPYQDLSGVIKVWAETCQTVVVYEHSADEEVPTTHVHLIMMGSKYATAEQYKKIFYKMIPSELKGNELWSWTHKKFPVPNLSFLTYMSKGILQPIFFQGITYEDIEELRKTWVNPASQTISKDAVVKSKGEQTKTHWQIMEDVMEDIRSRPKDRMTREASLTASYTFETIYDTVIRHLRINKVRTSRNELERFVVTIARDDDNFRDEIRDSIKRNIFR